MRYILAPLVVILSFVLLAWLGSLLHGALTVPLLNMTFGIAFICTLTVWYLYASFGVILMWISFGAAKHIWKKKMEKNSQTANKI